MVNVSVPYIISAPFKRLLLLTGMFFVLLLPSRAQGSAADAIDQAMKAGDASGISRYFGTSVDITINNNTSTYSRTQGEQVLRDFFSRNAVRQFEIQYSGTSTGGAATYTIGWLITGNGKYKTYFAFKPKDGGYVLKEIRFEK